MQWLTIFVGVLLTAFFLRVYYTDWPGEPRWPLPVFPHLMRDYGFWLCLVPCAWVGAAVLSVRSLDALPEMHSSYLAAGYALWAALGIAFLFSVDIAFGSGMGSGPSRMLDSTAVVSEPPASVDGPQMQRTLVVNSVFCVLGVAGGLFFAKASLGSIANLPIPWAARLVVGALLIPVMFVVSGVGAWLAHYCGLGQTVGVLMALPWVYAFVFAVGMTFSLRS